MGGGGVMAEYKWWGVNRHGVTIGGVTTADLAGLAAIVEDRFATGWRALSVKRDGIEVAGIGPDPSRPRRRTWWAECPKDDACIAEVAAGGAPSQEGQR
jgi:hypothetical protein